MTDDAAKTLPVGHVLGGKYRVDRLLGVGGMGAVYEAENTWTTRRVAIKVLQPELANAASIVKRFRVEAVAATKLQHPHIVDVLDMGEDATTGALFLVQEFLDGRDLRAHLEQRKRLPVAEALEVLVPITAALVAAHERGVLHRDLKPENIFLVTTPSGEVTPKLIDFGLALLDAGSAPTRMTQTGAVMGTPYYMSPEQARGDKAVDGRADVWAIATVLYELLVGVPPFEAATYNLLIYRILSETPPRVEVAAPEVPTVLGDVIARALTPDLASRTPDMRTFLNQLLDCPYLPDGRPDVGLRERHRKILPNPSLSRESPTAEHTPKSNDVGLARTLTPPEVSASAVSEVPAIKSVQGSQEAAAAPTHATQRPTPFGWDRPSKPALEQDPTPSVPVGRARKAVVALVGTAALAFALVIAWVMRPAPTPSVAPRGVSPTPITAPLVQPHVSVPPAPSARGDDTALAPDGASPTAPTVAEPNEMVTDAATPEAPDERAARRSHRRGRHGHDRSGDDAARETPARRNASDLLVPVAE